MTRSDVVWGMLYIVDDVKHIELRSQTGLALMMAILGTTCGQFGPTVSENKKEIMCLRAPGKNAADMAIRAAGQ